MIAKTKEADFFDYTEEFRTNRIRLITDGQAPVTLIDGPKIVLHIVPTKSFDRGMDLDTSLLELSNSDLRPITPTGSGPIRFNFDGRLNASYDGEKAGAYVQLFRNGIVESVSGYYFYLQDEKGEISVSALEEELIEVTPKYLEIQRRLNVEIPCFVMISLIGIKGYKLAVDRQAPWVRHVIDRNELFLPNAAIDSFDCKSDRVLRPLFDRIWNTAGYPKSPNYDENGNWKRRR